MIIDPPAEILIPEYAYPYLVAQRGAIDDMRDSPTVWCNRYIEMIEGEYKSIAPYLPKQCDAILDIGSGLGGIDILLSKHYGEGCQISLLDGINDPPNVTKHNETFSNATVAKRFLALNGISKLDFIDANNAYRAAPRFYDLIISFKSWCFHYEPARYLDFVQSCSIRGQTQLIIDVRRAEGKSDQGQWLNMLSDSFQHKAQIFAGFKFETHLFEAK